MKLSFFFFFSFLGVGSTLDVASVCQKCLDNEDCRRAYNMISEKACAPQNIQTFQAAFSMGAKRASVDADVRDAVAYAGFLPQCVDVNEQFDAVTNACSCLDGPCKAFVFSSLPLFVYCALIAIFLYVIVAVLEIVRKS